MPQLATLSQILGGRTAAPELKPLSQILNPSPANPTGEREAMGAADAFSQPIVGPQNLTPDFEQSPIGPPLDVPGFVERQSIDARTAAHNTVTGWWDRRRHLLDANSSSPTGGFQFRPPAMGGPVDPAVLAEFHKLNAADPFPMEDVRVLDDVAREGHLRRLRELGGEAGQIVGTPKPGLNVVENLAAQGGRALAGGMRMVADDLPGTAAKIGDSAGPLFQGAVKLSDLLNRGAAGLEKSAAAVQENLPQTQAGRLLTQGAGLGVDIGASALAGAVGGPGAASATFTTLFGGKAAGEAYQQAIAEGSNPREAMEYARFSGAKAALLVKLPLTWGRLGRETVATRLANAYVTGTAINTGDAVADEAWRGFVQGREMDAAAVERIAHAFVTGGPMGAGLQAVAGRGGEIRADRQPSQAPADTLAGAQKTPDPGVPIRSLIGQPEGPTASDTFGMTPKDGTVPPVVRPRQPYRPGALELQARPGDDLPSTLRRPLHENLPGQVDQQRYDAGELARAMGEVEGRQATRDVAPPQEATPEVAAPEPGTKKPWEAAEEAIQPYVDGLRGLSDKQLKAEEKRATAELNQWAKDTPALVPYDDGWSINPELHKQVGFEISARFNAVGREIDARKRGEKGAADAQEAQAGPREAPAPALTDRPPQAGADTQIPSPTQVRPPPAQNAPGGGRQPLDAFDPEAFDKNIRDKIKASKASGARHVDSIPPSHFGVERLRGEKVRDVVDGSTGTITTVDNNRNLHILFDSGTYAGSELFFPGNEVNRLAMEGREDVGEMQKRLVKTLDDERLRRLSHEAGANLARLARAEVKRREKSAAAGRMPVVEPSTQTLANEPPQPVKPTPSRRPVKLTQPRPFTRTDLERRMVKHFDEMGEKGVEDEKAVQFEKESQDTGGFEQVFKQIPSDLRDQFSKEEWRELRRRKILRTAEPGEVAGGEDAISESGMGFDRYVEMIRGRLGGTKVGKLERAVEFARKSPDPEMKLLAALHDNTPPAKRRGPVEIIDPSQQPPGTKFKLYGEEFEIVEQFDENGEGFRLLKDGDDYPVVPADAIPKFIADKGSVKEGSWEPPEQAGDFMEGLEEPPPQQADAPAGKLPIEEILKLITERKQVRAMLRSLPDSDAPGWSKALERYEQMAAPHRKRLEELDDLIGDRPKFWKPRAADPRDKRIAKQYGGGGDEPPAMGGVETGPAPDAPFALKSEGGTTGSMFTPPKAEATDTPKPPGKLDQLEQWAKDKLAELDKSTAEKVKKLPKGKRRGGGDITPEKLVLYGLIGAARIGKGAERFVTWSKKIVAEIPELAGAARHQLLRLWSVARRVHKMSEAERADYVTSAMTIGGEERPLTTIRRLTGQVDTSRAVTELQALRGSMRKAQAASTAGYRQGVRDVEGIKKELVRIVRENLPPDLHGAFLGDVARIRTMGQAALAIQKGRKLLAEHDLRESLTSLEDLVGRQALTVPKPKTNKQRQNEQKNPRILGDVDPDSLREVDLKKLPLDLRKQVRELLSQATYLRDSMKKRLDSGDVDAMIRGAEQFHAIEKQVREMVANHMAAEEIAVGDKLTRRDDVVKAAVAKINPPADTGPATGEPRGEKSVLAVAHRWQFNPETILGNLFGTDHDVYQLAHRDVVGAQVNYHRERQQFQKGLKEKLEAAGLKEESKRHKWLTERKPLALPGAGKVEMTRNEMLAVYAHAGDPTTKSLIERGVGWNFEGRRFGAADTHKLAPADVKAIEAELTAEERGVADWFKSYLDQNVTARALDAKLRVSGTAPDPIKGYFPRRRNLANREEVNLPSGWQGVAKKWLENISSMEERAPATDTPLLLRGFLETVDEHVDDAAGLIHLAEPVRMVAAVLEHPEVVNAIQRKHGDSLNRQVRQFLLDTLLVKQHPPRSGIERAAAAVGHNVSRANLQLNPSPMLKNALGGTISLLPEFEVRDWAHGVKHALDAGLYERMLETSPLVWNRYEGGGLYGQYSPLTEKHVEPAAQFTSVKEAIKAGKLGAAVDAIPWMRKADAVPFRAAFAAAERFVSRTRPELTGEAKTDAVLEKFHDAVMKTQNGSSSTEMPYIGAVARRNVFTQAFLMFKSDLFKRINQFGRWGRMDAGQRTRLVVSTALNALVTSGVALGIKEGAAGVGQLIGGTDRDPEAAERRLHAALWDAGRGIVGGVSGYADQVMAVIQGLHLGGEANLSNPVDTAIGELLEATGKVAGAIEDVAESTPGSERNAQVKDRMTGALVKFARAVRVGLLGDPTVPIERLAERAWKAAGFEAPDPRRQAVREKDARRRDLRQDLPAGVTQAVREYHRIGRIKPADRTPAERAAYGKLGAFNEFYERQMNRLEKGDQGAKASLESRAKALGY